MRPLRPARLRAEHASPGCACGVLDGAALQGRARRPDAAPRNRRSLCGCRPVMGRHAGDGARARPPGRPPRDGRRRLAREHPALGRRGEQACAPICRRRSPRALTAHEDAGTTDSQEYEDAVRVYYDRHVCRIPWPDCLERTFAQLAADPTVYHTMNGPSEFHCVGTLKTWDITDRLHEISTPTLLISGAPRRGDAPHRRADPLAHPGRAVGALRGVEPHVRTSRSRKRSSTTVEAFLKTID